MDHCLAPGQVIPIDVSAPFDKGTPLLSYNDLMTNNACFQHIYWGINLNVTNLYGLRRLICRPTGHFATFCDYLDQGK